jgi:hypothetical protein
LEYLDEWAAIEKKEKSIRDRIGELSSTMTKEQKAFIEKTEQAILLEKQTNEQLTNEFQNLVAEGMSGVDAINNMIKKYGEDVLDRMREKLAETNEWFKTHSISARDFDINRDYSKEIVTEDDYNKLKEEYGGKVPLVVVTPEQSVDFAWNAVRNARELNKSGVRKGPIIGEDEVEKAAANRFGFGSSSTTFTPYPKYEGVNLFNTTWGYVEGGKIQGTGVYPGTKLPLGQGRASGGYTEPGDVLEESKYKLHKGEWVAPQWMVRSGKYGSIIRSLEDHRRAATNEGSTHTNSDDKAKSLDIAANISTAQNTSGTNQRLDQLIQIIASQGNAQGRVLSPKTREQSFTR